MSDSLDIEPVYVPNRVFILQTLNYEINDLLNKKDKQYNLHINVIIKFDMYKKKKMKVMVVYRQYI